MFQETLLRVDALGKSLILYVIKPTVIVRSKDVLKVFVVQVYVAYHNSFESAKEDDSDEQVYDEERDKEHVVICEEHVIFHIAELEL